MSIFRSTGNGPLNSFQNPLNSVNTTGGNWRVNPYYLTPDYMANYRPDYAGPEGFNPNDQSDPTMAQAAIGMSPFGKGIPYYSNVSSYIDPSVSSFYQRPVDHSVSFAQRFVVPVASFAVANRLAQARVMTQNSLYRGGARFFAKFGGLSESAVASAGATQGVFTAMGDSLGRGAVNGMFSGARAFSRFGLLGDSAWAAGTRGVMADAAGIAGGVAGGVAIPLGLAYGATKAAQAAFFDPYIASRRTDMSLQRDFAGVYFGASGRPNSGLGFSHYASARASAGITTAGINDFTFNERDYGAIADFASRSGLFNDLSNPNDLKQRVKQVADEVKIVMSVANEPSVREAVKMLANLKMAGASSSVAGGVINQIGQSANAAGVSVQRLMNTVGSQGQYLYQANHLVPYLGQIAGANAMASFQSAFRQGLISPSLMAMMGGTEGASQSLVSGGIMAAQTPYNMMSLYNRYLGGGAHSGVFGNIGAFANSLSRNPLGALGAMNMNAPMMISRQLKDQGPLALLKQAQSLADMMPYLSKDGHGKYQAGALYQVMTGMMGLSPEEARAALIQAHSSSSDMNLSYLAGANRSFRIQQEQAITNQTGNWNPAWMGLKSAGHSVVSGVYNSLVSPTEEALGGLEDWTSKNYQRLVYGTKTPTGFANSVDQFLHGGAGKTHKAYNLPGGLYKYKNPGFFGLKASSTYRLQKKINDVLSGKIQVSPQVRAQIERIVNAKSASDIKDALGTLAYLPGGDVLGDVGGMSNDSAIISNLLSTKTQSVSDNPNANATLASLSKSAEKVVDLATGVNDAQSILSAPSLNAPGVQDAIAHISAISGGNNLSHEQILAQAKTVRNNYSKIPSSSRGRIALAATDAATQIVAHLADGTLPDFINKTAEGKRAKQIIAMASGRPESDFNNLTTLANAAKQIFVRAGKARMLGLGASTRGISAKDLLTGGAAINKRIAENAVTLGKGGLAGNSDNNYNLSESNADLAHQAQLVDQTIDKAGQITSGSQIGKTINYGDILQGLNDYSGKMNQAANTFAEAVRQFAGSVNSSHYRFMGK